VTHILNSGPPAVSGMGEVENLTRGWTMANTSQRKINCLWGSWLGSRYSRYLL